jgi:signal transduction histidine kinase
MDPGTEVGRPLAELADHDALGTIMANFVDNSFKHTPDGGSILVSTGRGRVFGEFCRVRSEQTHGIAGTGLGLSLVKRLVEQHLDCAPAGRGEGSRDRRGAFSIVPAMR